MKYKLTSLLLTVAALSIATAHADVPMFSGWYIEGNTGLSSITNTPYSGTTSNSGIPWNANLGYKFMPFLAMEMGYTHYSSVTDKYSGVTVGKETHYSYDLAAKGMVPISTTGLDLFAKIGVARINAHRTISNDAAATAAGFNSGNSNTTGLYIGAGGEYAIAPSVIGLLQWNRAQGNNSTGNADLYSVGISYLFE